MVGKSSRDYRRWDYDDEETEMNVEESLSLEENEDQGEGEEMGSSSTTFVQPTAMTSLTSHSRLNHHHSIHKRLTPGRRTKVSHSFHSLLHNIGAEACCWIRSS